MITFDEFMDEMIWQGGKVIARKGPWFVMANAKRGSYRIFVESAGNLKEVHKFQNDQDHKDIRKFGSRNLDTWLYETGGIE